MMEQNDVVCSVCEVNPQGSYRQLVFAVKTLDTTQIRNQLYQKRPSNTCACFIAELPI